MLSALVMTVMSRRPVSAAATSVVVDPESRMIVWPSPTSAAAARPMRSEEHTSELQSLMRISYAVFCLKKKKINDTTKIYKCTSYVTQSVTTNYYTTIHTSYNTYRHKH